MNPALLSCNQVNQFDLVDYLSFWGNLPTKNQRNNYCYLSPLIIQKTASSKVNSRMNGCYSYGIGISGRLIDSDNLYFGFFYMNYLSKLLVEKYHSFSFHQPSLIIYAGRKKHLDIPGKIHIFNQEDIAGLAFQLYQILRLLKLLIANRFCQQISFEMYGKNHRRVGFKNDSSGYELCSQFLSNLPH